MPRSLKTIWGASLLLLFALTACEKNTDSSANCAPAVLSDYVNPFIGTGGHGHTYPGPTMPFGMVQLSPDTRLDGWDGCGGYHYSDSIIFGFSHTHLQGTGVSDYGDILISPTNGQIKSGKKWHERYNSSFKKESEKASPGYYSVHLDDQNLQVELTTTTRVGVHRYTFDNEGDSCVIFMDMRHRDELLEYSFYPLNDSTIVGHRVSKAWNEAQHVYFVAVFDKAFIYNDQTYELTQTTDPETGNLVEEMEFVPIFPLDFKFQKELMVKVGISAVSIENAIANLEAEAPHWDFDQYHQDAVLAWSNELAKVEVSGGSEDELTKFYTALYHSYTVPNMFSDVNHIYRGTDGNLYQDETVDRYTVFSLWDTFRATHPLYTITQQKRTNDFLYGFLGMYNEGGQLPVWELASDYTGCMIGYHSVSAMADAYIKGTWEPHNPEYMLEAMIQAADSQHLGLPEYIKYGFIPSHAEHESVSKTLEYAYDDFCIAEVAKKMGNMEVYERFRKRALNYRNLYDDHTGFFRPKLGGAWVENFDPAEVNFNYTEANAYQYNFFVPHDIEGHIELMGGRSAFAHHLTSLFIADSTTTGRQQADITGLIGQYAHGNEPSHHMAYLYNYADEPWNTQMYTNKILSELYHNAPNGLSGNEDCGQMSSWYVLSALGFYPVCPGSPEYALTSPIFERGMIHLENGKAFIIENNKTSEDAIYIQSVKWNGADYTKSYITHDMIMEGGTLEFDLGTTANKLWGVGEGNRPHSSWNDEGFLPVPVILAPRTFRYPCNINFTCIDKEAKILYRRSDQPSSEWTEYAPPLQIDESVRFEFKAVKGDLESEVMEHEVKKMTNNYEIINISDYDNQYHAGGAQALIDGIVGDTNFKTGDWQGTYGKDVEVVIDLKGEQTIDFIDVGCLQDTKPWIIFPREVELYVQTIEKDAQGNDFTLWKLRSVVKNEIDPMDYTIQRQTLRLPLGVPCEQIKVVAKNFGPLPEGHLGAGNPSWLFLDEIEFIK